MASPASASAVPSPNNAPAVSTHVEESIVINAPVASVWAAISSLDFGWWPTVKATGGGVEGGNNPATAAAAVITLGSMRTLTFKDGTKWSLQVMEASLLNHSISFEVVGSDHGLPFTSCLHTICCKRVTNNNTTYINYTTEFSNDASAGEVLDSQYKKKEALVSLQAHFANAAAGATAWNKRQRHVRS